MPEVQARLPHGAAASTDVLQQGMRAVVPASFKANVAASQTDSVLVAAVAGFIIRVILFRLHAGATATDVTFNSKGSGAGVACSELFACAANGGRADGYVPIGHFDTTVGEALTATTGAGSTVGIGGKYILVKP